MSGWLPKKPAFVPVSSAAVEAQPWSAHSDSSVLNRVRVQSFRPALAASYPEIALPGVKLTVAPGSLTVPPTLG